MEAALAAMGGGLLLGLAGSLHCACMCGGIASGALFMLKPETAAQRLASFFLLQGGRITTYALAGGAVAGLTTLVVDPSTTAASFRVLQWAGALVLMWIGYPMAGMLPRVATPGLGNATAAFTAVVEPLLEPLRRYRRGAPFALGMTWGFTPCPMVYAALLAAALTGSVVYGALWMLFFGIGTLPGVSGAVLGVSLLARIRGHWGAELTAGVLIAAFGFATLYFGWPASVFCAPE